MDRRSFFRTIAKGVFATAASLYAPRLLEPEEEPVVDMFALKTKQGDDVGMLTLRQREAEAFIESMNKQLSELLFYGDTTADPTEFLGFKTWGVRWGEST